jgi:ATP-dependent DNA helicase RecG
LSENAKLTIPELARKMGISARKISQELKSLQEDFQVLKREGGRKNGYWVVLNE